MKKIMILLIIVLSTFLTVSFGLYQKSEDFNKMLTIEKTSDSLLFYVKEASVSVEQELSKFKQLSENYQASFVRTDRLSEKNRSIIFKSGIITPEYLNRLNDKVITGQGLSKNSDEFLATFETNKAEQVGTIRDLFSDNDMIIAPLSFFYDKHDESIIGNYSLTVSEENRQACLKELSDFFETPIPSLLTPQSGYHYEMGTGVLFIGLLSCLVLLLFILMVIFYPHVNFRKIGILKSLGYDNKAIWFDMTHYFLTIPFLVYSMTLIIQLRVVKNADWLYFFKLTVCQLTLVMTLIMMTFLMIVSINKIRLNSLIKGANYSKLPIYCSYLIKLSVLLALVGVLPILSQGIKEYSLVTEVKYYYEQEKDYLTLSGYHYNSNEFQNSLNGDDSFDIKLQNLYKELEHTANAEYVTTEKLQLSNSDMVENMTDYYKNWPTIMTVNFNYLNKLDIHTSVEKKELFTSEPLSVLVPFNLKPQAVDITSSLKALINTYLDKPFDLNDDVPVRIVYYTSMKEKLFSENIDFKDINQLVVKNPVFLCLSDRYLNTKSNVLINSALSNPLRIKNTTQNKKAIKQAILSNNLSDNNIVFSSVLESGYREISQQTKSLMAVFGLVTLFILFTSIFTSFYISFILLKSNRKKIMVKKMLGYSLLSRYATELVLFCSMYSIGIATLTVFKESNLDVISYFILIVIDGVITLSMILKNEAKELNRFLKGDE